MGMFDYVIIRTECPFCEKMVEGFQTKDGKLLFEKLTPAQVEIFYTTCPHCKKWIEFNRKKNETYYVNINDLLKDFKLVKQDSSENSTNRVKGCGRKMDALGYVICGEFDDLKHGGKQWLCEDCEKLNKSELTPEDKAKADNYVKETVHDLIKQSMDKDYSITTNKVGDGK